MAKKKTEGFKSIPYDNAHIEVTQEEYSEWEDILEVTPSGVDWYEWKTYHFLSDRGYFVSKPKCPEPKELTEDELEKRLEEDRSNPFFEVGERVAFEPTWTQSRILAEKQKMLKEKERELEKRAKKVEDAEKKQAVFDRERERITEECKDLRSRVKELELELEEEYQRGIELESELEDRVHRPDRPPTVSEMTVGEYNQRIKESVKRIAKWSAVGLLVITLIFGFGATVGEMSNEHKVKVLEEKCRPIIGSSRDF